MKDLTDPRWIKAKGVLFVFTGALAATMLLLEDFTLRRAFLLLVCVWSFCRAYYFAFYVIEHYVDPSYRFSGLGSFVRHCFVQRPANRPEPSARTEKRGPSPSSPK